MRTTRRTKASVTDDLGRQVAIPTTATDPTAALLLLHIRALAALVRQTRLVTLLADSAVSRAERVAQRDRQLREGIVQKRFIAGLHHWLVQVSIHDRTSTLLGDLVMFVPVLIARLLVIVMILNDPGLVYLSLRTTLDVPDSVGTFDVTDARVAISLAAAAGVTLLVLGSVRLVSHSLAALLYWPRLTRSGRYPEVLRSRERVGVPQLLVHLGTGALLLVVAVVVLHTFATARFGGVLNSAVDALGAGTGEARTAVIWLVTLLPFALLAMELVLAAPPFEHLRKVIRKAWRLRLAEWRDVRRDQRAARRLAQRLRRGERWVTAIQDLGTGVVISQTHDLAEAALNTGQPDLSALAPSMAIDAQWLTPADAGEVVVPDLTAAPAHGPLVQRHTAPTARAARVAARLRAITPPADSSEIARLWREARQAADAEAALHEVALQSTGRRTTGLSEETA